MLEEKLRIVAENVAKDLANKGEDLETYYLRVSTYLKNQEILPMSSEDNPTREVTIRIATKLQPKIGLKDFWGIEKKYVSFKESYLDDCAKEDLRRFNTLESMTKQYIIDQIKTPVKISEYGSTVDTYLSSLPEFKEWTSQSNKGHEVSIRLQERLKDSVTLITEPKNIGQYNWDAIASAIDNL